MRLKTTILSLVAVAIGVALVLTGGCQGSKPAPTGPAATTPGTKPATPADKPKTEPPKTDPKVTDKPKTDPPKVELPKVDEKVAKLQKAKEAFDKAQASWTKNPKDFDGAKKGFEEAKVVAAGTEVEKKCTDMIAKVVSEKAKADKAKADADKAKADADKAKADADKAKADADKAKAEKEAKTKAAKDAFEAAAVYCVENPKDFDGALKKIEATKPVTAGTDYAKKTEELGKQVQAAKEAKAKAPKPITEVLAKPAADVKDASEAWTKAEAAEKDKAKPERERAVAALPYYLAALNWKDADGARDDRAPAAALRIADITKEYAQDEDEAFSAGKFYILAAFIDLGSDSWEKAEKPYINNNKGVELADLLKKLAKNAATRSTELAADSDKESKAKSEKLKKFSATVGKRADELAAKYAAPAAPPKAPEPKK